MLDCSAIAKGFGVDCVARLLDSKGVKNYMINIGGELVMKGENQNMESWRIGINKPIDDSLAVNQELQTVLEITNAGLATSGNYRNFYYKDGKKYAHTIDPRTGYPVQHNILSSTVVAKTVQQPMLTLLRSWCSDLIRQRQSAMLILNSMLISSTNVKTGKWIFTLPMA